MGRPPLAVGTAGEINTRQVAKGWTAKVYVRDADGKRRELARWRPTQAAARAAVKDALRDRTDPSEAEGGLGPDTRLTVMAKHWLEDVATSDKAANTKQHYADTVARYVEPALGQLRLSELSVPRVDKALRLARTKHGPGAARSMRSVLSSMLGTAVRLGAMPANPVRDTARITGASSRTPRALTVEQQDRVMDAPRSSERALRHLDTPDLIDWLLGTGMRIGEACAIRSTSLDLEAGTVEINATVIRLKGVGLVIQEKPKSAAGWRVLALPEHLADMARRRRAELRAQPESVLALDVHDNVVTRDQPGLLFASPMGMLRDPRNTNGDLAETLAAIDCPHCDGTGLAHDKAGNVVRDKHRKPVLCDLGPFCWVTSHVFRKTVATRLDEAGLSARVIADVLGHSQPSMTQNVYMGRKVVSAEAASILGRPVARI